MTLKHYLVEHDRHRETPTRITEYMEGPEARKRLNQLDREQWDELNACLQEGKPVRMEYVVISGASLETVMRTHARYFFGDFQVSRPHSPVARRKKEASVQATG